MRDIKFRATDEKDGKIYQVNHIDNLNNSDETSYWTNDIEGGYKFYSKNLEQYTGLKDKNGVEIYEGDIVQHVRAYEDFPEIEPTKIGLPLVVDGGSYVYGKWIAREINEIGFGVNDYQFSKDLEVIGNIHENADLLEETT